MSRSSRLLALLAALVMVGGIPGTRAGEPESRPRQLLRAHSQGHIELDVELPAGWKLNPGSTLTYRLRTDGPGLVVPETDREGVVTPPRLPVTVAVSTGTPGDTVLTVSLAFAYCREDERGVCLLGSATIEQPIALTTAASTSRVRVSYRTPPPPAQFR